MLTVVVSSLYAHAQTNVQDRWPTIGQRKEPGSKAGDEIVALDGRPFKEIPSFEMEKLLSRNGAAYSVTISRGGKTPVMKIKL